MKAIKQPIFFSFLLIFVFGLLPVSALYAQNANKKIEITIKKVDDSGQEFEETIILEGDDARNADIDEIIKREIGDDDYEIDVEIEESAVSSKSACCSPGERAKCCPEKARMAKKGVLGVLIDDTEENMVSIQQVNSGSAAEEAGLQEGDMLKTVNDKKVGNYDELVTVLANFDAGDEVEIGYLRKNNLETTTATLQGRRFHNSARKSGCCAAPQKRSPKAHLGVYLKKSTVKGAIISEIMEDSPAQKAGLLPNDIIVKIDKVNIGNVDDLITEIAKYQPEDKVQVKFIRESQKQKVEVKLSENPTPKWRCGTSDASADMKRVKKQITVRKKSEERKETTIIGQNNTLEFDDLELFPNPTDTKFTLNFSLAEQRPVKINISDMNGTIIISENIDNFNGSFSKIFDLSDAPQGIYLINISQRDKTFTEKLYLNNKN